MAGVGVESREEDARVVSGDSDTPPVDGRGLRRFVWATLVGGLVAGVPFLWVLTNEWSGSYNAVRRISYLSGFYDNQAESMIHGHLWVSTGSLGIEGFVHDGRTYTYFGLLLSILRIPFLLVAPSVSGHLTAPSIVVAWMLTGLFSVLLIWRVRMLLRGPVAVGWAEAVSWGVVTATILGGSVLLFLASEPWVYDEDIAWTVPITIATLFVFLGILDRPSIGKVLAAGGLVLAGVLERPSPALACIVGALLIAGWFYFGRGDSRQRRWVLPMVAVAAVPFLVSSVVNWLKFGTLLNGLPLSEQVWTHVNAHRRAFLAATAGNGYSFHFLPTTIWAYLQPFGLRAQPTFPFLSLPIAPPHVYGGYVVDILYPTASVPASMPLLFLVSCWAIVMAFRPHPGRGMVLMRIPLLVGAGATLVDFLLGYIAPRYLGDFLPFLVLGAAIGLVDLWRRWDGGTLRTKGLAVAGVVILAVVSLAANLGIALAPTTEWTAKQAVHYLQAVNAVSGATGNPLRRQITVGTVMPYQAPAGQVFIGGDCVGMYLSSGKPVSAAPTLQLEHKMWVPVEQSSAITTRMVMTVNAPGEIGPGLRVLTVGRDVVSLRSVGTRSVQFVLDDPRYPTTGKVVTPKIGRTYHLVVSADPFLNRITVNIGNRTVLSGVLSGAGTGTSPLVVHTTPLPAGGAVPPVVIAHGRQTFLDMSLCRSLLRGH